MVVLHETPHLGEQGQILNLQSGKIAESDSGAAIELVIEIERSFRPLHHRRARNGIAVDQQEKIVRPGLSRAVHLDAENQRFRFRTQRQRDRILGPFVGALQVAALHVLERERTAVVVLPHPQTEEVAYVFRLEKTPQLDLFAGEIDRYAERDG